MSRRLKARSVEIVDLLRFYDFSINILDKNLAGSLTKTTDIWHKTLPGLRPPLWLHRVSPSSVSGIKVEFNSTAVQ